MRLHHLNLIVPDLEAAVVRWRAVLGAEPVREDLAQRGARTARFDLAGTWLVLVEPVDPDGVPGRYLAEHGPGLFLLSFGVDELPAAVTEALARGIATCGTPRSGLDGWHVQDLTPDPATGVHVQLCAARGPSPG